MAKKLKDNGAGEPGVGHNVGELKRDLMLAAQEIARIDEQIAELRAEKNLIKQAKVKAHGVKLADFNTVARWRSLENKDRNETIDNIRLCCEALGIGGQGEFFPTPAVVAGAEARA